MVRFGTAIAFDPLTGMNERCSYDKCMGNIVHTVDEIARTVVEEWACIFCGRAPRPDRWHTGPIQKFKKKNSGRYTRVPCATNA